MINAPLGAATNIIALAAILASAVFTLIAIRPQFGPYLYLIANPLIVGIARGDMVAILRPNEALLILIVAALATRILFLRLAGEYNRPPTSRVDLAFVLLALASSVVPLLLRFGRDLPVSTDDLLYSIVIWKFFLLYRVFRVSISTPSQVARCLWLSMTSAAIVAVIGMLQVQGLLGIPELLYTYYDNPFEGQVGPLTERGTSTIASAFGLADAMIMNLVVAMALLESQRGGRWVLIPAAGLFLGGCIVTGEFSGFIGLGVAVLVFGFISGRLSRLLTMGVPATAVASVVFWPVIATRLLGFERPSGLPHSWTGRWADLRDSFFPELFSDLNWLVGVRPTARLPAPETWRQFIYIESGYVWLLWVGGIPMVAAFAFFVWVSAQHLWRVTRERTDPVGAAAAASLTYLVVLVTLMLFGPHLTLRGSADLFFPLLALSFVRARDVSFARFSRHVVWGGQLPVPHK
jgi:hypothetical protein